MKRQLIPALISALLLLSSCNTVQTLEVESVPESSAPVSSEAISSEAASSLADSSAPASSEAIPSAAESATASSLPQSSQEEPPKEVASSTPAASAPPLVAKKEEPPKSAEPAPPPVQAPNETTEQAEVQGNTVPEGRRAMTEAEVDAAIEDAIAYAESRGMTWYDDFSVESSRFYNPANSTAGKDIFMKDLIYHVDQLYEISTTESYYEEGNYIYYKIVTGPIEDEENAWFGYVLY